MAGVLVGGAFLSGFINVVLDRLISVDAINLVAGKKLSSDLVERLRNALMDAGALVDDAELKQLDNHDVKEWLNCLRDALYTADDLLDRVCTKAATQKGVCNFLPSFLNSEERQMVKEIERVVTRIEDLEKRKGKLGLEKISTASFSWKTTSTSLVKGNVYGREDDQKALVQMLNDNNEHHLSVISIVGIGGVGKTTLAQWMYNNAELMEGFDRKAWVCVSENFNIVETTRNIVKEISTNTQDLDSFNSIQDALKKGLSEKKFFIVLDDVWSNDHHQWKDFLAPFLYGVKGSTILLTTRKEDVGSVVQTNYHPHYLIPLSEDYCWSVIEELGEQEEKKVLTRHLSHISRGSLGPRISKVSNSIAKLESLRTSLYIDDLFNLESIASKFKYLRVLSFHKLDVLPDSIGELIHLRYLNLSWTDINMLPELLCNLYNLQTLILYGCTKLTMLPSGMHNLVNLRHLDLRKTSLEEMPGGISKLKHLRVLDFFIVGKHEDNGIHELGGLSNLHGSFQLKKLENIVDVKEAENARMINKNLISKLYLEWSSGGDMVSNTQTEREILHSLEPHNGLRELTIRRYRGTIFPDWLGHCSYNNMTHVSLVCCMNCCMLPSLGQLPSLKSLYIRDFGQLSSIGIEFYKNEDNPSLHIAPFPSLETLQLQDMPCWEVWNLPDSETFRQLKSLQITDCPMLKGDMLHHVLMRIVSSSMDVSKVRKLEILQDDKERFQQMLLSGDTLLFSGSESMVESAFKAMISINHISCLHEIIIRRCRKLEFPQLQLQKYDLVELLIEESCDSLTSLSLGVFPNLKNLQIKRCRNLESVSMSEAPHAALQRLSIYDCHKLVSFAGEGLAAPNLIHLQVAWCSKLEALPRDMNSLLPSLEFLDIRGCRNICRLAEGGLPPNLKSLEVGICEQQMRDPSWMPNLHALTHLRIEGHYCNNIKSYPEVGSLPHLPSLTTLEIWHFHNLETLECNELLRLTSLQQLHISFCRKLENMEGAMLPSSLLLFKMEYCPLLEEHCKNKHQLIWPKISHIPTIQFLTTDAVNLVLGKKLGSDLVERLKISLHAAEVLVGDAEDKQLDNQPVRDWLHSLRDSVYWADDLLDAVFTKAATRKEVDSFWPISLLNRDKEMIDKMERVVRRIEFLEKQKDFLGLEKTTKKNFLSWRIPSTSLVEELASRLFFKQCEYFDKCFVMHNLLHDLALFLAGDFYCRFEEHGKVESVTTYTRHLSYDSLSHLISEHFDSINKVESLRTLLPNNFFSHSDNIDSITCTLILKLKYLRVLSFLSFEGLNVLPESIGELTYLRYLDLSETSIRTLPESLCDLYNLQTLKLNECSSLTMLPNGMHKLVNLRHLSIRRTCLKEMPEEMSKLKHLHFLSYFMVGKHEDNGIQELGGLLNLHGSFEIKKLENVVDAKQARSARMLDKKHIDNLLLEWCSDVSKIRKLSIQKDHKGRSQEILLKGDSLSIKGCESVMGSAFKAMSINLLTYLQEIQISGCSYAVSFRGDCLPKSLQKLTILNCSKLEFPQQKYNFMELYIKDSCDSLSSFSLDDFPNLNNLKIEKCETLKSLSLSEPPHAALKHLFIDDCCKFVSFPVEGLAAPNLTHLRVTYCYKLESLPANMNTLLPNLQSLEIQRCSEICKLPKGGFPPNLKELSVGGCEEQLKGLSSMCHFNALIELTIEGYFGVTSYPKVGSLPQLPLLTTLRLWGFLDLETLECDQLLHLTSLQQLHIQWCVKLENMEGQNLPSSLLLLQIIECPLLGEHCKKKDEQYWSKIFYIPTIQVDAFLSGFINVLFDRFLTTDAVNLVLGKKLGPDLVERLKISLHAAEVLVDDAEYKQLGNEHVRDWLNSLRDAVYVADDLLDAVLTKAATQKETEVSSFLNPINFFINRDREMVDKMEGVVRRIEYLEKQKDFLGLEKSTKKNFLSWRIPSTSLVEALFLAGDFYCSFEELGDVDNMSDRTRHLSYKKLSHLSSKHFDSISKVESLRTLLLINLFPHSCKADVETSCILISKLKRLRVLSFLRFERFEALPDSIGELTYLRYLDLSRTSIRTLPESLCDLYNLQTLKLNGCSCLTMLPNGMHKLVNLRHLDIWGTSLEGMPGGMNKLKHLHFLSFFMVGKHDDNTIQELEGLLNLHGSFEIKKLENVVDVKEARRAKILDKKHIECLLLEWSSGDDMVSDTQTERDILNSLQPHNGLKKLKIKGYKGTIFPDWLGFCSYNNMTSVSLESCKNCCMLPSLGQLPSLKSLRIRGFDQLRSIGDEFYKNEGDHHSSPIAPFPLLESLEFDNLPCWDVWHLSESETFPQLRKLEIRYCPMLKGHMLNHVFLRMFSSLLDVSNVRKLDILEDDKKRSQKMLDNGETLSIRGCKYILEYAFKATIVHHLTSLQELQISGCLSAVSFPGNCITKSLQKLKILNSSKLEFPQQEQKYDLVELKIENSCDSLTSFSLDAFPNLKNLEISWCWNLESVSMSERPHAALQRLTIHQCSKFVSFPREGVDAPNLTHFNVTGCSKLEALPCHMNSLLPNLQSLNIRDCQKMCRLPEGGLPPNLKELTIGKQWKVLSTMGNSDALTHLSIYDCDWYNKSTRSFPEVGLLPPLPSLTTLCLYYFPNLETLECIELLRLTSLQQLSIMSCPKLENMVGEKLPPSLSLLQIKGCPLLGEHCNNKHQLIWPKISHIPNIQVHRKQFF
ncbi:hypothetical protein Ahy_A02g009879 isoform B [Arachis hypogaea]|uniref:Disease resistance RPP13-like protein 1 n=1 Tax=Arachis hypogaea TaxID=3818 RepID=A0A445EIE9_ARAHY|nr:hypothetical protein Ahy_A02g009879 isoform B [Arachis hypogaea]